MMWRVTVYDGKHHPVDSKEVAFVTAGKKAFINAVKKAAPALLEPYVAMEIKAPQHCMGDITGDLASTRGMVTGTETDCSSQLTILASAPVSCVNNYNTRLKAFTAGEGQYLSRFSHYAAVPADVQRQLIEAWKQDDVN